MQYLTIKELKKLKRQGIIFNNLQNVLISKGCKIEKGAKIGDYVQILGDSVISSGVEITSFSTVQNSTILVGTIVNKSEITDSRIGKNCQIGPFAHIKQNSELKDNIRIGNFVEIKNSTIKSGTKCAHLTYIGDAEVGERVNFGCGVVIANYNGKKKFKTKIGNDCFIGCNCNLIAPIEVGNNCFIAAGSTITKNLPDGKFCVARSDEKIKDNTFKKD